jgi:DNA-binding SARP family transcriptional activator
MSTPITIHSLGGLTIQREGQPITGLASRKAEALLVYLAANPRPHPREILAEMLWDERSQSQAMANLRVVLSSLSIAPYPRQPSTISAARS